MIELPELVGNDSIKRTLRDRMFHAYLIDGAPGSGRHTLLRMLLQAFVCSAETKPCGQCVHCLRQQAGEHTDIRFLSPDMKPEDLRLALADITSFPGDAVRKVYVMDRMQDANATVQNILLKNLEEPPSHAVFVLLCDTRESVLETIRSRCVALTLMPVSDGEMRTWLQTKYPETYQAQIDAAVALSGGYIGRAVSVLESGDTDAYERCRMIEDVLRRGRYAEIPDLCVWKENKKSSKDVRAEMTAFQNSLHVYMQRLFCNAVRNGSEEICVWSRVCHELDKIRDYPDYNLNVTLWSLCIAKALITAYDMKRK